MDTFKTKEAALQEAVKRKKENNDLLEMVMRQEDGKFLICGWKDWETAINHRGCEPVYASGYIHDLAVGRDATEEDNRMELDTIMNRHHPGGVTKATSYAEVRKKKAKKKKPKLSPADCDRWDTPPGATYLISNPKHDE